MKNIVKSVPIERIVHREKSDRSEFSGSSGTRQPPRFAGKKKRRRNSKRNTRYVQA